MSTLRSREVLRFGFSSEVAVQDQDVVLVLSSCPNDASLVANLLAQSGYLCVASRDVGVYASDTSKLDETEDQYIATVLCHRVAKNDESVVPCPNKMPGERVIVMTDCSLEDTAVSLFERGAHHVFNIRESQRLLQARLEAALRKHSLLASSSFSLGEIHFDVPRRQVSRGGILVDLSPKEYDLAYYLFCNRDRIVGNSELMTSIWSLPPSMDTRRIDTAACRLRKKLELTARNGWELKRLRRVGYQLVPVKAHEADGGHGTMSSIDAAHSAVVNDIQIEPNWLDNSIQSVAGQRR